MTTDDGPDPAAAWWTVTDVAAYLRVKPDTVSGYKTRRQMPEPDEQVGRTPVWRPATIIEWRPRTARGEEDRTAPPPPTD